ncbi:MAG: hypothetical protein ACRD04_04540 [Terriglobales bacterium]
MAETIQGGVRYVLVALGIVTVVLAVLMTRENLWWMAIPDALFGIGVGWMAVASGHAERHPQMVEAEPAPEPRREPVKPPSVPEPVAVAVGVSKPAAPESAAPATTPSRPARSGKKKKRRR